MQSCELLAVNVVYDWYYSSKKLPSMTVREVLQGVSEEFEIPMDLRAFEYEYVEFHGIMLLRLSDARK